jgi:hypothetical protein
MTRCCCGRPRPADALIRLSRKEQRHDPAQRSRSHVRTEDHCGDEPCRRSPVRSDKPCTGPDQHERRIAATCRARRNHRERVGNVSRDPIADAGAGRSFSTVAPRAAGPCERRYFEDPGANRRRQELPHLPGLLTLTALHFQTSSGLLAVVHMGWRLSRRALFKSAPLKKKVRAGGCQALTYGRGHRGCAGLSGRCATRAPTPDPRCRRSRRCRA